MRYALLGDIHSNFGDLEVVLLHIKEIAPDAQIIGLGDLFECVIGKKRAKNERFTQLSDVMIRPNGFEEILTFPTIKGNQEQRIIDITSTDEGLFKLLENLPETIELPHAVVIHGHQWEWNGDPWTPIIPDFGDKIVFYGHSHRAGIMERNESILFTYNETIKLHHLNIQVNVGSVIDHVEWLLYDAELHTISFMKAKK
jgi:predicted phosphodiesterase